MPKSGVTPLPVTQAALLTIEVDPPLRVEQTVAMVETTPPRPQHDLFISHASEDKEAFVRPLAQALAKLGASIWYDELSLNVGDSLSGSIDRGLADSRYGVVVISKAFIAKPWPKRELAGLVARQMAAGGAKTILPVWHGVSHQDVLEFSPPLADTVALNTATDGAEDVSLKLLKVVRPDLYEAHPRAELLRMATGTALNDLLSEIDATRAELEEARASLSEFQCPTCGAGLDVKTVVPLNDPRYPHETDYMLERFTCGYESADGRQLKPCPYDPSYPSPQDFELVTKQLQDGRWYCHAKPKTYNARLIDVASGTGETAEAAETDVRRRLPKRRTRKD